MLLTLLKVDAEDRSDYWNMEGEEVMRLTEGGCAARKVIHGIQGKISGAQFQGFARVCRYLRTVSSTLVTPHLLPPSRNAAKIQLEAVESRRTTICRV